MFILFLATVGLLYLGYKAIMALPKGKEEPLTEDEIRWCFPEIICSKVVTKYSLDLINRQKAEIENLCIEIDDLIIAKDSFL